MDWVSFHKYPLNYISENYHSIHSEDRVLIIYPYFKKKKKKPKTNNLIILTGKGLTPVCYSALFADPICSVTLFVILHTLETMAM